MWLRTAIPEGTPVVRDSHRRRDRDSHCRRDTHRGPRQDRGFVLIATLWTLAVMAVLAVPHTLNYVTRPATATRAATRPVTAA